jgi:thioredoxin-dependent peroxiredoxin
VDLNPAKGYVGRTMKMTMKMGILVGILGSVLGLLNAFAAEKIKVGDPAPKLSAKNENNEIIEIKYGDGYTMVYFYPRADTPGCTAQACSLRDHYDELVKKGVNVYGVSTDSPEDQKKFKLKYHLPFTLIADTDKKVADAFGVPVRVGFTSRQAFLMKAGKVVWLDRTASTAEQAKDILDYMSSTK